MHVVGCDPISESGVVALLRNRAEVWPATEGQLGAATVAVVVAETVDEEGMALLERARAAGPKAAVMIVCGVDGAGLTRAAQSEVSAVLRRRETTADRLVRTVSAVARGARVRRPGPGHASAPEPDRAEEERGDRVTQREREVLRLVATGLDTREIAEQLAYSERTVKNALSVYADRFHLRNRSHAVAHAIREGVI